MKLGERGETNVLPWLVFLTGFVLFATTFVTMYVSSVFAEEEEAVIDIDTTLDVDLENYQPRSSDRLTLTYEFENIVEGFLGLLIGYWPWRDADNSQQINLRIMYLKVTQPEGEYLIWKTDIDDFEDVVENQVFMKDVAFQWRANDDWDDLRAADFLITSTITELDVVDNHVTFAISSDYQYPEWGVMAAISAIASFNIPHVPRFIAMIIAVPFWVLVSYVSVKLLAGIIGAIIPG